MQFSCPNCAQSMKCPDDYAGRKAICPKCGQKVLVPTPPNPPKPPKPTNKTTLGTLEDDASLMIFPMAITVPPKPSSQVSQELPFEDNDVGRDADPRDHSGLGIASFLIALLVIGLDIILVLMIAFGIAGSRERVAMRDQFLSGGMALICLNCMSIPLCLIGGGLGLAGVIAHQRKNNLFSWIGLIGNASIVIGVISLYILINVLASTQPPVHRRF